MKYWLSILGIFLISGFAQAQKIKVSLTVQNIQPGDVSTWGPAAANGVIQDLYVPPGNVKVVLKITGSNGGALICGVTPALAPSETINNTKVLTVADIQGALGSCVLPPGSYFLCLQIYDEKNTPLCDEVCKPFTVEEPKQLANDYTGPALVAPANESNITDPKKPVTLMWTQVTPKPQGIVTYTVRVYAVEKGQEPAQVIKTNSPVLEKEVNNITQTIWPISAEYANSNENQIFVWNVQATDKDGKGYGANNGVSEYAVFGIIYEVNDGGTWSSSNGANATVGSISPSKATCRDFIVKVK